MLNESQFHQITFRICEHCNRNCKYCHYHKNNIFYNFNQIKNIIDYLNTKFQNILFYLHGGEPTLHPDFNKIINYITDYNNKIELQTNFDFKIDKYILSKIEYLNISFHYPYINYKEKLKKILLLHKLKKIKNIDLIFINKSNEIFCEIKYFLEKYNIPFEVTYNFFDSYNFEKEFKRLKCNNISKDEIIKNKYFNKEYSFKNKYCDTKKYVIINGNGNIFKCSYELTFNISRGNILEKPDLLNEVMNIEKCKYDYCGYEKYYL